MLNYAHCSGRLENSCGHQQDEYRLDVNFGTQNLWTQGKELVVLELFLAISLVSGGGSSLRKEKTKGEG